MAKEQGLFGTGRGSGRRPSRRGLLRAGLLQGLAIGALALGPRAALGQAGGAHAHMRDLGVAKLPIVPAMDQPLVEPEVRRSVNGVLAPACAAPMPIATSAACASICAPTKAGWARRCA